MAAVSVSKKFYEGRSAHLFFGLLTFFIAVLATLATRGYYQNTHYGDFFGYFAALKNLVNGLGLWGGPQYQHLLGNHAYLTLLLLTPLVWLFQTPLIFIYVSLSCWALSALLFFKICKQLNTDFIKNDLVLWLLIVLHLVYPLALQFAAPNYDSFQPDFMMPLFLLGIFLGLLRKSRVLLFICIAFFLATKEEFIFLFPFVFIWLIVAHYLLYGTLWLTKKDFLIIAAIFLMLGAVSTTLLLHYRALNLFSVSARSHVFYNSLFNVSLLKGSLKSVFYLQLCLAPCMIILLTKKEKTLRCFVLVTLIGAVLGREALNLLIYGRVVPFSFHSRAILVPVLMILIAVGASIFRRRENNTARSLFIALISSLALSVLINFKLPIDSITQFAALSGDQHEWHTLRVQLQEIHKILSPYKLPTTRFALSENLAPTFAKDGDYVPAWLLQNRCKLVVGMFNIAILKKSESPLEQFKCLRPDFISIGETAEYLILKKRTLEPHGG